MKITDKQIKEITKGALTVEQENGVLAFYRIPRDTASNFTKLSEDMKIRTLASSGVRFDFYSDTQYLKIGYLLKPGSSRIKGAFDVWVNGKLYASEGEDAIDGIPREIEAAFERGEKHITVYFPTLAQTFISSVELSDGATLTPCENKPLALFFGDSITQGYTTDLPSLNYPTRFCETAGLDFYNFGVGAAVYKGFIAEIEVDRTPELVFSAYGTNDWFVGVSSGALRKNMRDFYGTLCSKYPSSRIISILPIWRDDAKGADKPIGSFDDLFILMRDILSEFPQVEIIDGRELVPHTRRLFADAFLHPNDIGFEFFTNALLEKILK